MTTEVADTSERSSESVRHRNLSVGDAMILVAVAALALAFGSRLFGPLAQQFDALGRNISQYDSPFFKARPGQWRKTIWYSSMSLLWCVFRILDVSLLSVVPGFLLIRLRRPRPCILTVIKQPGTVAGISIVLGAIWVTGWLHHLFVARFNYYTLSSVAVGCTVTLSWALLAASGRWEAERSWIDRMGRVLGVIAVGNGVLAYVICGI